jgi:Na+/H+ antiporter NhaC
MELKELISAARHIRPWALLVFSFIAFLSLNNANPPELVTVANTDMTVVVAQR